MFRQGQLCDVLLVADDVQLSAHRVVLAACSHYFSAMFTSKLSESRTERILLQQIDGKTLSALVDFIYTSEIRITEDNVQVNFKSDVRFSVLIESDQVSFSVHLRSDSFRRIN